MVFQWIPGQGPDPDSLARIERHFPRPATAMGEAWFMGEEREMYPSLLERDVAEHSFEELQVFLVEIASGLKSMGLSDAWPEWYGYLMPRCLPRSFQRESRNFGDYLVEYLVTAFMSVMPDSSIDWGYDAFRDDALKTLGQAIMAPDLWPRGSEKSVDCLHPKAIDRPGYPVWTETSGDFAASMFFCLKYLEANDIPGWIKSAFAIPCPRWRAQMLVWLCDVKSFLDSTLLQPSEMEGNYTLYGGWAWSHIINGRNMAYNEWKEPIEFLSAGNRARCHETISELLNEKLLSEWLESLMEFESLFDQLTATEVPERLRRAYQF